MRVHRCCVQSFAKIVEIAWEEFEKVGLRDFRNLRSKTEPEMGVAYITRFSTIQWMGEYKYFECVTKYMWVIREKCTFFDYSATLWWKLRMTIDNYDKFGEFRGMFRQWKMQSFGTKKSSFE